MSLYYDVFLERRVFQSSVCAMRWFISDEAKRETMIFRKMKSMRKCMTACLDSEEGNEEMRHFGGITTSNRERMNEY